MFFPIIFYVDTNKERKLIQRFIKHNSQSNKHVDNRVNNCDNKT